MENINFEGLERALNNGYYISIYTVGMKYLGIAVLRDDQNFFTVLDGNTLSLMNHANNKLLNSSLEDREYPQTAVDAVIEQGFGLLFYKLANGRVLTMISEYELDEMGNDIPIKSIITNDIKSGFATLNAVLESSYLCTLDKFNAFANEQVFPILQYQKKLSRKTSH